MNPSELFNKLLEYASDELYSDIHINSSHKPIIRDKSGYIKTLDSIGEYETSEFDDEGIGEIINTIASDVGYEKFLKDMELDISYKYEKTGDRYRVNCYIDSNGYNVALRIIPSKMPTMEELGLGDIVKDMCSKNRGLILMTGPTGSGKSTNLAAMLDYINNNFKKHIITIEDPVEFSIKSNKSLVNQREVGNHTKGFAESMRAALREDPDVIMIGEMRDPETIRTALSLAETGHLVLSTLHTNDSVQTIDRIVDVFPSGQQTQIRMQLAMSLLGVISQRLLPKKEGEGKVAAREIMTSNDAIRNLIISGKTHQLYGMVEIGQKDGMILMDKYLMALYTKGIIDRDTLFSYARDKDNIAMMVE